ncbi:hypothetical protein BDQ94DRAFT_133881 [Aspergillus welwitschiae]|uniref:Uncharacterized protein n=1 Tax=Aspergillus welwitschiae TaxID=1341132 RepID=A0A3F3QGY4_9EURO|nr:hypothetical protein BDQ94DRAFT_133881 [Aspergillus welwitschiae]RDH38441.1 hypothetical protein BDQ94DRAFT_133881 [Aspergillus welwitschiae]
MPWEKPLSRSHPKWFLLLRPRALVPCSVLGESRWIFPFIQGSDHPRGPLNFSAHHRHWGAPTPPAKFPALR